MWIIFALAAGCVWALSNLVEKLILDKKAKSIWGTLLLFEICNGIVATAIVVWGWEYLHAIWWIVALCALGNVIGVVFYLLALQREDISRVVPLWLLGLVILPIGDALWLHHILSIKQYAAIIGLVILGFLLVVNPKRGLTRSLIVFVFMIISTGGYSSMWLLGDTVIEQIPALYFTASIALVRSLAILTASVVLGWWQRPTIKTIITWSNLKWTAFTTIASLAGFTFYFQSLRDSVPALVDALTLVQYILVFAIPMLVNFIWPNSYAEKFSVRQLVGKCIIIIGMISCGLVLIL